MEKIRIRDSDPQLSSNVVVVPAKKDR
jgi:hypothetical protein